MTEELLDTLIDHAAGNFRTLMNMAAELLMAGMAQEGVKLDEKLYLETFQVEPARLRQKSPKQKETR